MIRSLVLSLVMVPMLASAGGFMKRAEQGQDLFATVKTNQGDIVIRLFSKDAPKTVANFVGLATGEKEWTHPGTGEKQKNKPLYNEVIFHRVIAGFMIQGGDPLGKGFGGPGYTFEDEKSSRKFDRPGLVAMANSGPNTNGSQFFITVAPTPHLNGGYNLFGEVVAGYDVVERISKVETGPQNRPQVPVVIKTIAISAEKPGTVAPAKKK